MSALILVVDDIPANVKLLEAKLSNEYYDVITAGDGPTALEQVRKHKPDLVLLDVMMPEMNGFEVCTALKADGEVSHIPVVMVTALTDTSDRVQGLECGADDFISKPINDTALFARVKSLIRIKVLWDELRLRDQTGKQVGMFLGNENSFRADVTGSSIALIEDDIVHSRNIIERLSGHYQVLHYEDPEEAMEALKGEVRPDALLISTLLSDADGLRLAAKLKNVEHLRNMPIVIMVDEEEQHIILKALELGINDYLCVPVELNELEARLKVQLRRKKYQDLLRANQQESVSMAVTDGLTGLYNRNYLDAHLANMIRQAQQNAKSLAVMMMDMDHFKIVNDTYGHDVGDEILVELARRIVATIRSSDLAARVGGEEFVVIMPETDIAEAHQTADRLRLEVAENPFPISHETASLERTISIGLADLDMQGDDAAALLKRADTALYEAKHGGRNRRCPVYAEAKAASERGKK